MTQYELRIECPYEINDADNVTSPDEIFAHCHGVVSIEPSGTDTAIAERVDGQQMKLTLEVVHDVKKINGEKQDIWKIVGWEYGTVGTTPELTSTGSGEVSSVFDLEELIGTLTLWSEINTPLWKERSPSFSTERGTVVFTLIDELTVGVTSDDIPIDVIKMKSPIATEDIFQETMIDYLLSKKYLV